MEILRYFCLSSCLPPIYNHTGFVSTLSSPRGFAFVSGSLVPLKSQSSSESSLGPLLSVSKLLPHVNFFTGPERVGRGEGSLTSTHLGKNDKTSRRVSPISYFSPVIAGEKSSLRYIFLHSHEAKSLEV